MPYADNFTPVNHALLISREYTAAEKLVLIWLASKPEDWDVIEGQVRGELNLGHDTTERILRDLRRKGAITKPPRQRRPDGTWTKQYGRLTPALRAEIRHVPAGHSRSGESRDGISRAGKARGYTKESRTNENTTNETTPPHEAESYVQGPDRAARPYESGPSSTDGNSSTDANSSSGDDLGCRCWCDMCRNGWHSDCYASAVCNVRTAA